MELFELIVVEVEKEEDIVFVGSNIYLETVFGSNHTLIAKCYKIQSFFMGDGLLYRANPPIFSTEEEANKWSEAINASFGKEKDWSYFKDLTEISKEDLEAMLDKDKNLDLEKENILSICNLGYKVAVFKIT